MTRTVIVLAVSALLSIGCAARRAVVPDPTVPHRVAKEAEVTIWTRAPGGELVKAKVRLLPGWWIAGPPVVEVEP